MSAIDFRRIRIAGMILAICLVTPLEAQSLVRASSLTESTAVAQSENARSRGPADFVGPRIDGGRAGIRALAAVRVDATAAPFVQPAISRKRGVPQMIIGGAALVGGAIIGNDAGTLIMLGGLGYGLYGLYLYLQ